MVLIIDGMEYTSNLDYCQYFVAALTFSFALVAWVAFYMLQDVTNSVGNFKYSFQILRLLHKHFNFNFVPQTCLKMM